MQQDLSRVKQTELPNVFHSFDHSNARAQAIVDPV